MERIEKLKKQNCLLNTMDDFRKGDRVKVIESRIKENFGRNHGVSKEPLTFIKAYSDNRGTAHFKTPGGEVITLKINNVRFV